MTRELVLASTYLIGFTRTGIVAGWYDWKASRIFSTI